MSADAPSRDDAALAEPQAPHDDLSFEDLMRRYNFQQTSHEPRVLTRLVIKECQRRASPIRVLDIGCGRGIARRPGYQRAIRPHVDEYWGLEPDEGVEPQPGIFDRHLGALMEDAELPPDSFDVVYSSMVMEHVVDTDRFMNAVARCLKPGGCYLFITPNRRHYFGRIALLLNRLRLDELVLRVINRKAERQQGSEVDYHYPLAYRFNDERRIDACALRCGFLAPEYAYFEALGPHRYMIGPMRPVFHLLVKKRRVLRNPRALVVIGCRITKAPASGG